MSSRVLFLAAEATPFTKVGGLGDVAGSLPRALRALPEGPDVRVVLPLHGGARARAGRLEHVAYVRVDHPSGPIQGEVLRAAEHPVPIYFVSGPPIDENGPVYHADAGRDAHRFTWFSLASLELCRALDFRPDVVHAHDWHTGPAVVAIARRRALDPFFERTRTIITVHNLPYQGHGGGAAMRAFGLAPLDAPLLPEAVRELPLPAALWVADRITTVSPGYAREMLATEHGAGLDGLLRTRLASDSGLLVGILNGLDLAAWDPASDTALVQRYDVSSLEGRAVNKRALLRELGLREDLDVPLIGLVSRLTDQKGADLLPDALRSIAAHGTRFQAVLLGAGDPHVEQALYALGVELADRVRVRVGFDEGLARRIYAGADMLALPSRYEPCGLAQMIAMRYGCVPVARETGGLADTVRDLDLHDDATGFLFPVASWRSLEFGLRRAIATWAHQARFRQLVIDGMTEDFSWGRAALAYARTYAAITAAASGAGPHRM